MEYITAEQFNDTIWMMQSFWLVLSGITSVWCFSSIIIELVKMYTFKEDSKEVFRSILNILKALIYLIPMGIMTLLVSNVYKDNINMEIMSKAIIVIIGVVSILISIIYKSYIRKNAEKKENKKK